MTPFLLAAQWYEDAQGGLGEKFLAATIDGLFEIEKHPKRFALIQEEIEGVSHSAETDRPILVRSRV